VTTSRFPLAQLLWVPCTLIAFVSMFGHMTGLNNVGIALTGVTVLAALWLERRELREWPLVVPIALWAAWTFAAVLWSAYPRVSLHAWLDEVLYPLMVFWGFWLFASRVERARYVAFSCLAACVSLALISAIYWGQLQPPTPETFPLRFYARVGHTSTLALFAIPVFLGLMVHGKTRWFGIAGVLLALFVGLASLNRFFWPAVVVTLCVALVPVFRHRPRRALILLAILLIGACTALLFFSRFVSASTPAPAPGSEPVAVVLSEVPQRLLAFDQKMHTDTRPMLWAFYGKHALHHPWLGVGFGKPLPGMVLRPQMPAALIAAEPLAPTHAHDMLLNTWLQTGVLGVVLQIVLLASLACRYWKLRRVDEWLAAAGLALVIGMVVKNVMDDFMWKTTMLAFWAFAGLLLGVGTRESSRTAMERL
jgi:O-antigen ligase